MRGMLSPSLMCADPLNVQQELTVLDDLGVDYIHLDFMDNHFVPNLTLSPELIKATKKVLRHMKRDIHIMAVEPQQYFDRMDIGEGDIVAVHYEACPDLAAVLADIRQRGATPAIALSPDTEPEVLTELAAVRKLIDESGYRPLLEVDGHVSWELCREMRARGADMFVAGSSSLYQEGLDISEAVARMSELVK